MDQSPAQVALILLVLKGANAMGAASESAVNAVEACVSELRAVELVEINDAFQKLFDGTCGMCEECGKRIPETRIKLILCPSASPANVIASA
jgi:RNA polymerase-binding transcription factor DksA